MTALLIWVLGLLSHPSITVNVTTGTATVVSPTLVRTYPVVVGRHGWDTPVGTWHITATVELPTGSPYGPRALVTDAPGRKDSGFNGVIALHGAAHTGDLHQHLSHGCVRFTDAAITEIAALPGMTPGTEIHIINQPPRPTKEIR